MTQIVPTKFEGEFEAMKKVNMSTVKSEDMLRGSWTN